MKEPPNHPWLEEILRQEEPYLDNAGFSKNVMESLPPRRHFTNKMNRCLIKLVSIMVGTMLSLSFLWDLGIPSDILPGLSTEMTMELVAVGIFGTIAAASVWVMSDRY